jgi:hypothetical protein
LKRPSPALVIACVALFASLGGTGYAATQLHSGAIDAKAKSKAKAPKTLTSGQVNKLIAAYVTAHHIGATGPAGAQGPAGAPGGEGKVGPQGPGAQRIDLSSGQSAATKVATFGPWTLTMTCEATGTVTVINGPGSFTFTESFGPMGGTASTSSSSVTVDGFGTGVGNGNQQGMHGFLRSGSTVIQLDLETTASSGPETCGVIGDAIPIT